ncbi:MAG: glycosyl transferase [Actinomycetota bacterium]
MADFFQNGVVSTLHALGDRPDDEVEKELVDFSRETPMALVLPSLFSELEGPALSAIVDQIAEVPYLAEIVIGLDAADRAQFETAREFFSRLPQRHRILWNDGPRLRALDAALQEEGLAPQLPGKGRNVWYCLGYTLASGRSKAVAMHDCDILTYDRSMLARLFYPIVHPSFDYAFCKGYYYRSANGRLNGRVARLFVTPLVRALASTLGSNPYLEYLDSFRYPLAGEQSMRIDVVGSVRIPADWGLEIGLLSEVHRQYNPKRVCQVDLADAYDHKHQDVSFDDPNAGLNRMATDIAKAMFRKLATNGEVLSPETFRTVKAAYYRGALDMVGRYQDDAIINGLEFDLHAEEETVELFAAAVMRAGEQFLSNPMEAPFLPSWSRVRSAMPDVLDRIADAVEADQLD